MLVYLIIALTQGAAKGHGRDALIFAVISYSLHDLSKAGLLVCLSLSCDHQVHAFKLLIEFYKLQHTFYA